MRNSQLNMAHSIRQSIKKIWLAFEVLRNEPTISPEDYHVVLFLLSVYRRGVAESENYENLWERGPFHPSTPIDKYLKISSLDEEDVLQVVYKEIYRDIIKPESSHKWGISGHGLSKIREKFSAIDKRVISSDFSAIFDATLYYLAMSKGKDAGHHILPKDLAQLTIALANPAEGARVYNPFAGMASFGMFLPKSCSYLGQELDRVTWAIGMLRIEAYNYHNDEIFDLRLEDSILRWPREKKFDLIIASPPFNMRMTGGHKDAFPYSKRVEQFFIKEGLNSLNEQGKLIALVPQNILFHAGATKKLRQILVEEDLVEAVISFPGGLLLNTSIPFVLLVINKAKDYPGYVKFVDAKTYVKTGRPYNKIENWSNLIIDVSARTESDNVRIVSIKDIAATGYNLSVSRFFIEQIEGVPLRRLIKPLEGEPIKTPFMGRHVRIKNLKDDILSNTLNTQDLSIEKINRSDVRVLNDSCLLLAVRWKSLKPTFFKYSGDSIVISNDIQAFKIEESLVDIDYLINELNADYVTNQLEAYRDGATIPAIRPEDLLKIKIKLPSIEEQRGKTLGIQELSRKIRVLQSERNALAHGADMQFAESMSSIKHSLGKPLLNIGSSIRNIETALDKINKDWRQFRLSERRDVTLQDSFDSIQRNLEFVHSILKRNERDFDLNNYDLHDLDFLGYIKEYVGHLKASISTDVKIRLDIHDDIVLQFEDFVVIKGNKELLDMAFNIIVENAEKHAFTDKGKGHKLEFRVGLHLESSKNPRSQDKTGAFDSFLKVEVANNGKSVPAGFDLDKLIRINSKAGRTGNTGQGGYDLNEIVKKHNGGNSTLKFLTDDPTTEFTTIYSFLLPL